MHRFCLSLGQAPIGRREDSRPQLGRGHCSLRDCACLGEEALGTVLRASRNARVWRGLQEGFDAFVALGEGGDLDGMVAAGVVLVEGLGGLARNDEVGVRLLRRASELGSAQGLFELGTLTFCGAAGLKEDEHAAFELFQRCAQQRHAGGMFMVADCLLEGVGCEQDQAQAVPLLLEAANLGHRGARQHLRQLLDGNWAGFLNQGSRDV